MGLGSSQLGLRDASGGCEGIRGGGGGVKRWGGGSSDGVRLWESWRRGGPNRRAGGGWTGLSWVNRILRN